MDDEWLVEQCIAGRTAYWNVLVRRYQEPLVKKVSFFFTNPDEAQDVVDEIFVRAKSSLASFKEFTRNRNAYPGTRDIEALFLIWMSRFAAELCIRKKGEK